MTAAVAENADLRSRPRAGRGPALLGSAGRSLDRNFFRTAPVFSYACRLFCATNQENYR